MGEEPCRSAQQSADLDQTNDQKVDQANHQDASHHSELAVHSQVAQNDHRQVHVTVQNCLSANGAHACDLSGLVATSEGSALRDCAVELFFGPLVGFPVAVVKSDAAGSFRIADLPTGFYSLRATSPEGAVAEHHHVRLEPGRESHVCLRLGPVPARRRKNRTRVPPTTALPEPTAWEP